MENENQLNILTIAPRGTRTITSSISGAKVEGSAEEEEECRRQKRQNYSTTRSMFFFVAGLFSFRCYYIYIEAVTTIGRKHTVQGTNSLPFETSLLWCGCGWLLTHTAQMARAKVIPFREKRSHIYGVIIGEAQLAGKGARSKSRGGGSHTETGR